MILILLVVLIQDEYKKKWQEKYNTIEEPTTFELELFLDTVAVKEGGLKKGRVLGLGTLDQAMASLMETEPGGSCNSGVGSADPAILLEMEELRKQNAAYAQIQSGITQVLQYVVKVAGTQMEVPEAVAQFMTSVGDGTSFSQPTTSTSYQPSSNLNQANQDSDLHPEPES